MKVREERVLADRKLAKSGGQIDEWLAGDERRQLLDECEDIGV